MISQPIGQHGLASTAGPTDGRQSAPVADNDRPPSGFQLIFGKAHQAKLFVEWPVLIIERAALAAC
jgi:hypothetical protein